ncbi:unnamed protein product [Linum trigynum]|uniref:Uncharacterized protein n=1 Tax=Linum trigynum TaxID=586398 RepID=A0AAV2DNW7_9ROSI
MGGRSINFGPNSNRRVGITNPLWICVYGMHGWIMDVQQLFILVGNLQAVVSKSPLALASKQYHFSTMWRSQSDLYALA